MNVKLFLIGLVMIFCQMQLVRAEVLSIEAEGSYIFSVDFAENLPTAKEYALEKARQTAVEQAGIFVQSHSEVKNSQLLMDKVTVIAGAILEVMKDDYRLNSSPDGKTIEVVCMVKARVDTDKLNLQDLVDREQLLDTISEKDKRMQELLEENKRLKAQVTQSTSDVRRWEIQSELDSNSRLFLIAKYERSLDVFNLDRKIDWALLMETAQKLTALDSQNSTAFRVTTMYYRNNEDMHVVADYCKKVLETSKTPLLSIEALSQLGDIYFNEFNDKASARKYVDRAIALAKKQYSRSEIEELVNGTDVEWKDLRLTGRTNSIRDLYILKSDIEDAVPSFDVLTKIDSFVVEEDKFYNIKYRTDW